MPLGVTLESLNHMEINVIEIVQLVTKQINVRLCSLSTTIYYLKGLVFYQKERERLEKKKCVTYTGKNAGSRYCLR